MMRCATSLLLLLVSGLAGCAGTEPLISFKDPAYRTAHFRTVLVLVDSTDDQWRASVESSIAEAMEMRGLRSLLGSKVVPPTRIWSASERRDSILAAGADAMLECLVDERGIDTRYQPPQTTTKTSVTTEQHGKKGDSIRNQTFTTTTSTITTGGDTIRSSWTRLSVKLIDVANGKVAWMTSYRLYDSPGDRAVFAKRLATTLKEDEIVARR
jgi:hypothetical protein